MKPQEMVPVTILTGFLGSGKTTLLNRILKEQHGRRIAVIENEFGEVGIDNALLVQDAGEQIIEMNNGCICCTVRGDLVRILGELQSKREAKQLDFERIIIETTGMADPGPVAQTFFMDEDMATTTCSIPSSPWWTPSTRRSNWTISAKRRSRSASPTASCCP